jgi:hypothetical protein
MSRLGSARCKNKLEEGARLGSFEAREPLRAEPSRSELEPAREPRANFPALVTIECPSPNYGDNFVHNLCSSFSPTIATMLVFCTTNHRI